MTSHAYRLAFAALFAGCSASNFDDPGVTDSSSSVMDTANEPNDTAMRMDTGTPKDTSATTSDGDATELDCAALGGPKCKAGTACVPRIASGVIAGHHCAEPTGELGSGCLPTCSGASAASRCRAGSCFLYVKTGAEACGFVCETDTDCKTTGICCKKTPDVQCKDGACVGGKCTKPGMCAEC